MGSGIDRVRVLIGAVETTFVYIYTHQCVYLVVPSYVRRGEIGMVVDTPL